MNYDHDGTGKADLYANNGAISNHWVNDYRLVAQQLTTEFSSANQATFTFTTDPERLPERIDADQDMYLLEMQDFLVAIRKDGQTRTPLREGAKSLDMALAAVRSAESGGEVRLAWER